MDLKMSKCTAYPNGDKHWFLNGELHRVDGPAIENANGTKRWYLNDKRHRVDGPAVEYANGDKYWYLNGELHRVDGPGIEYVNGDKHWYLNGEEITHKQWLAEIWHILSNAEQKRLAFNGFEELR
jgi:hypothetical protein